MHGVTCLLVPDFSMFDFEASFREDFGQLLAALHEREKLARRKEGGWEAFLCEAASAVPYYARYFSGHTPTTIEEFPLVTRSMLSSNVDDFLNRGFSRQNLIWMTTSGTSGQPLAVARDGTSIYAMHYDIFSQIWTELNLASNLLVAGRCAVAVVNDNPTLSPAETINPALGLASVHHLILGRGEASDREVVSRLEELRPILLSGRPRALHHLLELGGAACAKCGILAIFCSGDNLTPSDQNQLSNGFAAPVHNGYASQEGGLIALERTPGPTALTTSPGVRVEVLASNNQLASEGDGELVVSSCANWAMPIIRYRSGDHGLVRRSHAANGKGCEISRLDGRVSVHFVVGCHRHNPSVLNSDLEMHSTQFQVTQTCALTFRVALVPRNPAIQTEIVNHVRLAFQRHFGAVDVSVELVDQIGRPGEKVQRYVVKQADNSNEQACSQ